MMKKNIYKYLIYTILIVFLVMMARGILQEQDTSSSDEGMNAVRAQVLEITFDNTDKKPDKEGVNEYRYQEFRVRIKEGKHKGEIYWMRNTIETADVYNIHLDEGERILVSVSEDESGKISNLHIYDKQRENHLYLIIGIFFAIILIIGGYQGAKSIVTLVFTGIMIVGVLLPLILKGYNPVLVAVFVSTVVVCVTLIIIGGFSKKTVAAILGTLGGVLIAGIIALAIGYSSQITGLANENTQSLVYLLKYPDMDFRGILFAGIIIGALGAVMDVSMSISSAMHEMMDIKPDITRKQLTKSGMNVGKDIMGSMSNTLILAYTGGAIELMLLFMASKMTWREIINLDMVAAEIIRAVSGSIGLACTIPLTALICAAMKSSKS
ncbi:MAG: YibE/F family protein [Tepidibacter sp.]|jgi:uncharacterized membrane protein|nr:YibE/F family protein [Tepidibacter sp.]